MDNLKEDDYPLCVQQPKKTKHYHSYLVQIQYTSS